MKDNSTPYIQMKLADLFPKGTEYHQVDFLYCKFELFDSYTLNIWESIYITIEI